MRPLRRGDIVALGPHRLMCGDAGDSADVARLMGGVKADLVFTSPPYLQQRTYGQAIACWDTLMQRVFGALPVHERTQVLVNLGLVHRKGEWLPYWDGWIEWMRARGWRRFGWYVWDKLEATPGDHNGRLAPCAEWIFHFVQRARVPNKTVACMRPNEQGSRGNVRRSVSGAADARKGFRSTGTHKIQDSVVRVRPEKGPARSLGHPALSPVPLPLYIHAAYTNPGEIVYDPFCGAGTSILAAHQGGRIAYGMEIDPAYCDIAVGRWHKAQDPRKSRRIRRTPTPDTDRQMDMWPAC